MTGIDMISTTMSTSMTSMSGVMFNSIIGAPEPPSLCTPIDMYGFLEGLARNADACGIRLGDEADLDDATTLQVVHHPADRLITRILVAANVEFRLRRLAGLTDDLLEEDLLVGDQPGVPIDLARSIHRNGDVLGLGLRRNVRRFRNRHIGHLLNHGHGDQKDDQQHEHDVDERSRVDLRHDASFAFTRTDTHRHWALPLNGGT